jgi:hypothetical protein
MGNSRRFWPDHGDFRSTSVNLRIAGHVSKVPTSDMLETQVADYSGNPAICSAAPSLVASAGAQSTPANC